MKSKRRSKSPEEVNAALAALHMEPGFFIGPYNPIVLNIGGKLALVDTGTSEATFASSNGRTGQLMTNLAAAGIDAGAIDTVIISHYHGDHFDHIAETRLRKDVPIVTTSHAASELSAKGFTAPIALDTWESFIARKGDSRAGRVEGAPSSLRPYATYLRASTSTTRSG